MKNAPLISSILIIGFLIQLNSLEAQERLVISRIEGDFNEIYVEQILNEAYGRLGIQVEYIEYPPKRSLLTSNLGEVDGELIRIRGIEKDYPNLLRVKIPITSSELVVFTKDKNFRPDGWESLKPYSIAIMRGILVIENGTRNLDSYSFNDAKKALKLVSFGRYDITVLPRIDALGHLKHLKLANLRMLEPPVAKVELFHYLHKKHKNLIPRITESLRHLEKIGELKLIRDRFIAEFLQ